MEQPATIDIRLPEKGLFFLNKKARYKVAVGGRGSAKSVSMGICAIIKALEGKRRILCTRQYQANIKDSIHKLLSDYIQRLGFAQFFEITKDSIRGYNGSEFIFSGVQNNIAGIKSMEGIDICICEEAQTMSNESWEILIPTIRKEGSEFWIAFNPESEDDPTYQRFVKNPPDNCLTVQMNYTDNPFFPEVLRQEMEYCKRVDYFKYQHIWEGQPTSQTEALVFKGKFVVQDFEIPSRYDVDRFFIGVDWGFSCLDGNTLITTSRGEVPLKEVKVGDMVLTRAGYRKVLLNQYKGIKPVFSITVNNEKNLIATADHRIYTADGWKEVKDLREKEQLCLVQFRKSYLMEKFTKGMQRANTLIISTIRPEKFSKSYIGKFISFTKVKFLAGILYTTKTATRLITVLQTLFVYLKANTQKCISKIPLELSRRKAQEKCAKNLAIQKRTGTLDGLKQLKQPNYGVENAKSAGGIFSLLMYIKSIVALIAGKKQTVERAKKSIFAKIAESISLLLRTLRIRLVVKNAPIHCRPMGKRKVYDLTIEGEHEYFANGILVHNCDPTTMVLSFIKDNCLYICREGYGIGVDLAQIPQKIFSCVPEAAQGWPIYCDNARPETISFLKARRWRVMVDGKPAEVSYNLKPADKWKGSVEDGVDRLKSFEKIIIHPSCKHTIEEFSHYCYETDKRTGELLPKLVDTYNHCIDGIRYSLNGYITRKGADWLRAYMRDVY